jgi:hypothetical protein
VQLRGARFFDGSFALMFAVDELTFELSMKLEVLELFVSALNEWSTNTFEVCRLLMAVVVGDRPTDAVRLNQVMRK